MKVWRSKVKRKHDGKVLTDNFYFKVAVNLILLLIPETHMYFLIGKGIFKIILNEFILYFIFEIMLL